MPRARTERHRALVQFRVSGKHFRCRFFAGAVLLLTLSTGVTSNSADFEAMSAAIVKINQYRVDHGRATVTMDNRLTQAAVRHARAMADQDFFSHVGADGSSMGKRVTEAGYIWRLVAENIAAGMVGPVAAVETWIDSPGHRRNLLLKGAKHIGLAHVRREPDPGSVNFRDYWVLLLAAPQ